VSKKEREEKAQEEVKAIRDAIKKKKLKWKAGITSVSLLTEEERKNLLGALPKKEKAERKDKGEKEKSGASHAGESTDPPAEWDWRDVSGDDWTTPIKNQRGCGSCVAFSVNAAMEMLLKKWIYNDTQVIPDLSEAHLYFCNGRRCTQAEGNYGWWIDSALDALKSDGVPDECCFEYEAPPTQACGDACSDWKDRIDLTKIRDWKSITNVTEMKKLLSEHGCMPANMAVFTDFLSYAGGIYSYAWGQLLGYHAVTVIGYNDVDECWICKNSWGTCWGEPPLGKPLPQPAGWFRIAYGEPNGPIPIGASANKIDDEMFKIELICPAEASGLAIGLNQKTIGMVRQFRDKLLHTEKGSAYLSVAVRNIGDVTRILHVLEANKDLTIEAGKALKPFLEAVEALDSAKPMRLQEDYFKAVIKVLDRMAEIDRKLAPALSRVKEEIPTYFGKTLKEIMDML
jgi:C1A family cysteine protease